MIDISMAGIDHSKATIEERELFSFTGQQAQKAISQWKKEKAVTGCLLLSTCNRTELWVTGGWTKEELLHMLCRVKDLKPEEYEDRFTSRAGNEAITHLLELTCGLRSMIRGEDQILSQIREALKCARICNAADTLIEKLFQTALSAGKKVKTQVKFDHANPSAAQNCLLLIQETFGKVEQIPCLIIGNGQIGQLAAKTLKEADADVSMTLRRRFHGNQEETSASIPGCRMLEYEKRLEKIESYKVVISATLSPHHTVRAVDLEGKQFKNVLWIDMALPRDMDPAIGEIHGIRLLDVDELGAYPAKEEEACLEAEKILQEYEEELEQWYAFRRHVDMVKRISLLVKEDMGVRTAKRISDKQAHAFIEEAIQKTMEKLLFGLKETLPRDQWKTCLTALEQSAQRDTIKT